MFCFKKRSYSPKKQEKTNAKNNNNNNKELVTLEGSKKLVSIRRKSSKDKITIRFTSNLNKKQ